MIDAALTDGVRWLIVDLERAALGPRSRSRRWPPPGCGCASVAVS